MIALKFAAIVLGAGALISLILTEVGADFLLAIAACLS
jgi:hypothetical protein